MMKRRIRPSVNYAVSRYQREWDTTHLLVVPLYKMVAAALPKEFNVIEVRDFIFIDIIFNRLHGKLSYIVLLGADKMCL